MKVQTLINLDRITAVNICTNNDRIYLVFQDGRHNYGYPMKDMEYAQKALKTIEKDNPKWWRVLGEPREIQFKIYGDE